MNCFFIGHRDAPHSLALQLDESIERHITQYGVHEFIVGNRGDFDRQAISAVKRAKKDTHISRWSFCWPTTPLIARQN